MKNKIPPYFKKLLFLIVLVFTGLGTYANHLVGMDLYYTWVSGNTYKITLIAYANCGSAGPGTAYDALPTNAPTVHIYNGNSYVDEVTLSIQAPSTGVEITPVCPADLLLTQCTNTGFTIPGIKKFVYSANYTLPGTSAVWRFLFTGSMASSSFIAGRAISITNISSTPATYIQLVDTLNNTTSHNSSPFLSVVPTPFFCLDASDNYNPGATDPEGDSLKFSLVTGMSGTASSASGGPVTYISPYTPTAPLAASSFVFDSHTGQISFVPNALQRSLVVYNIDEYRGGVFVGSSQREMTFLVLTCTNTAASGGLVAATAGIIDDSTHFHICANSGAFSVSINPTEPGSPNLITVTSSGMPAGATFNVVGNGTTTPHCTFSWSSTGVTPGAYTFFVTFTDNNCPLSGTQTLAYTITIVAAPTISYTLLSAATCTKKAAISVIPGGGGIPWAVKLSNSASPFDTIQSFPFVYTSFTDSLSPGSYFLTAFNYPTKQCKASAAVTIASPPPIVPTATFINPSYCGNNDGSIKLSNLNAGGLDTIKYTYNGVAQTPIITVVASDGTVLISGLKAGTYTNITATNGYCISSSLGPIVLTNPAFTMRAVGFTNPEYCGICNGTIKLYGLRPGQLDTVNFTRNGLPQTAIVQFVGADSIITINGVCTGTYANFVAKTAGVCVSNTLGPIVLTAPFTMRALTSTNPDFCGICNGVIKIWGLHPGQTDTITYTKDGIAQTPVVQAIGSDSTLTISGLCAGTYANFIARTGGVCVSNTLGPVTLTVPPFTMRALTGINPDYCGICNGSIKLYGLHPGQTDTITYTKDGVAQTPYVHLVGSDSTLTITGLCAGVYNNFIARTGGVCVSNTLGPISLTVPPFTMRAITSTNPDYCGICNGTIKLWGLHPGQTDTISYTKDGVAQTPIIQFVGTDSTITMTGLCFGVYGNFIARTGGVCVSNTLGPVSLVVPPFSMRALTFTNPDYCGICNGSIKLWGLHPGQTDTITYTKDGAPQTFVQLIGPDSTVTLTGLCAGLYNNFVAHTGGVCVSNTLGPANLVVPPFTMRALSHTNPDYCGICNGTITLYGLHPGQLDTITYTKDGIAQAPVIHLIGADSTVVLTGLCFGTYSNFVAHTGGVCVSNSLGPVALVVPPFSMRALTFTNPTKCGFCDGTIKLYGLHPGQTDTITYNFNGVPQTPVSYFIGTDSIVILSGLCEGTYDNIVARTASVCVSNTLGPALLDAPPIIPGYTFVIHEDCTGDTVVFTNTSWPASDLTYTWSFGDGTTSTAVNPSHVYYLPGTYNVGLTITNTRCVDSVTHSFALQNLVHGAFTSNPDNFVCTGKPVTFTNGSSGTLLHYNWTYGDGNSDTAASPVYTYLHTGIYTVTMVVTNYVPCYDTVTTVLEVDSVSAISISATDSVLCSGHAVTFTGIFSPQGNTGTTWSFNGTDAINNVNPILHSFDGGDMYTVSLTAFYRACPDTTATRKIFVFDHPAINLGPDTSICIGSSPIYLYDIINANKANARWQWNTGQTGPGINVVAPGYYSATVSIDGCYSSDTVWVTNSCYIDIPNAFTPNGDGVNDYFMPRDVLTKGLSTFKMEIYNRWGQLIFETDHIEGRGWDGRFNGEPQPQGVFVYRIEASFIDGQKEQHQGNVTLLR